MPHETVGKFNTTAFSNSLMTSLGTGIASKGLSLLAGKKEKRTSPAGEGFGQKAYFKALYGNKLNPWEWAGAGGHGQGGTAAPNAAGIQARNTLQEKQNVDISMQAAQLRNNIDVAKIGAGLTPGDDVPTGSKQGTGIRKMESEIDNIQTRTHILTTAKNMTNEITAVMDNIKGESDTMLQQVNKGINEVIKAIQNKKDKALLGIDTYKHKLKMLWREFKKSKQTKPDVHLKFKKSPRSTSSPRK